MKAIGLFAIVSGHYTPPGYEYLYAFSVQLFFIISGFLNKRVPFDVFLKKISRQLIIPMLILGCISILLSNIRLFLNGSFTLTALGQSLVGMLLGQQIALGGLWFVYTLIVAKVVARLPKLYLKFIVASLFLVCAILYNQQPMHTIQNCWFNVILAYPMFFIGELASKYKTTINGFQNRLMLFGMLIIGIAGVIISGIFNGPVWMYRCLYGNNLGYFLLGSLCGTLMVFAFSKLFLDKPFKLVTTISEGSIIILALHMQLVLIGLHYPVGYGYYLESALIMLIFVPIIKFCQKRLPILVGYRGVHNPTLSSATE